MVSSKTRRAYNGDGLVHEVGIGNHPLKRLHTTHGNAYHGFDVVDSEFACQKLILRVHHVVHGDPGKPHSRLQAAIGGGRRHSVGQSIDKDDEILRAVGESPRTNVALQLLSSPRRPGGDEHRVWFVGIKLTEGAVADAAVAKNFSADELEIAEGSELLLGGSCIL